MHSKNVLCVFRKKHLSGFWWPSITDMDMNNYVDALLLFSEKKTRCHVLLYELSKLHTSKLLLAPTRELRNFNGCRRACQEVCPSWSFVSILYISFGRGFMWSCGPYRCNVISHLSHYSSLYHTCVAVQYVLHVQFLEKNTIVRSKTMISSIVLSPAYFGWCPRMDKKL